MRAHLFVTASGLNLREEPSADSKILLVLPYGTLVETRGIFLNGWHHVRLDSSGVTGWVSGKHVRWEKAPWMILAERELGVSEVAGGVHNPRIIAYHSATTLKATTDEIPWCSSYACWVMEGSGILSPRSAAARDWLGWGVEIKEPQYGCITVLDRKTRNNPRSAHVGFFARAPLYLLGGNQRNRVGVDAFDVSRVLGYRMPGERELAKAA